MKGFALVLSLLLVLLLTLFAISLLWIASSYYAVPHHLLEIENARLACQSAMQWLVDRHNLETDPVPFFFDQRNWSGSEIKPFVWNGFQIFAESRAPWDPIGTNLFVVRAIKGEYKAEQSLRIRQRRPENFALFADSPVRLPLSSLIDGLIFVRSSLELQQPTRFREAVYADIQPLRNASFRKMTFQRLPFPQLKEFLSLSAVQEHAQEKGLTVTQEHPAFWRGDAFEVDLDQLQFERRGDSWSIGYGGTAIGTVKELHIWFDGPVRIRQTERAAEFFPTGKSQFPLRLSTASDLFLDTSVQSLEGSMVEHPICFISGGVIHITSRVRKAVRFHASLIALGSSNDASLVIEAGGEPITPEQVSNWQREIDSSVFVLEQQKRDELMQVLEEGEKIVWFRGSLLLKSGLQIPVDLTQLHFEASTKAYPFLPSFSFVYIEEGSRQWL